MRSNGGLCFGRVPEGGVFFSGVFLECFSVLLRPSNTRDFGLFDCLGEQHDH